MNDTALVGDNGLTVTHAQLESIVAEAGSTLRRNHEGAVVAVLLNSGVEAIVAHLAIRAAGAIPAVLNARWWPREQRAALDALDPDLVLVDDEANSGGWTGSTITIRPASEAASILAEIRTPRTTAEGAASPEWISFSAGHFGEPKPQRLVMSSFDGLPRGQVLVVTNPPGDPCVLTSALATLELGGAVHAIDRWLPRPAARRIGDLRTAHLLTTPPHLTLLLEAFGEHAPELSAVHTTGAALPVSLADRARQRTGATITSHYTVAEAGGIVASRDALVGHPLDLGNPRVGMSLEIEGDDSLRIEVAGRSVRPGDLVASAGEGFRLLGRQVERFVAHGRAVDPLALELALAEDDGIALVAVVPRPDETAGATPVAFTVPTNRDDPPFLHELAPALAPFPEHAWPTAQCVSDAIAMSPAGQLHRRLLIYEESTR